MASPDGRPWGARPTIFYRPTVLTTHISGTKRHDNVRSVPVRRDCGGYGITLCRTGTRPTGTAGVQLEEILVCARCRAAGKARYEHAQPDERARFRPRLLTDQQGPADLQRLVDGG